MEVKLVQTIAIDKVKFIFEPMENFQFFFYCQTNIRKKINKSNGRKRREEENKKNTKLLLKYY